MSGQEVFVAMLAIIILVIHAISAMKVLKQIDHGKLDHNSTVSPPEIVVGVSAISEIIVAASLFARIVVTLFPPIW